MKWKEVLERASKLTPEQLEMVVSVVSLDKESVVGVVDMVTSWGPTMDPNDNTYYTYGLDIVEDELPEGNPYLTIY